MTSAENPLRPLRVLVVDDEPLARSRLLTLLGDCQNPHISAVVQVGRAVDAMEMLAHSVANKIVHATGDKPTHGATQAAFDVVLLDIHMPGMNGLNFAQHLRTLPNPPAVVFVTAHAEHAVQAFELEAVDYLTKPVRLERLQAALQKVQRLQPILHGLQADSASNTTLKIPSHTLLIQDRGRVERVPLSDVLYFKAELKYLTVRTAAKCHIFEGALNELEAQHPQFLRIHRNALVARHALRALERQHSSEPGEEGELWVVRLNGVEETLAVSRRQLAAVRVVLAQG
jgi:two-component system response regulator AlgR